MNIHSISRNKAPFSRTLLAAAISISLIPITSYAGLKPSDIKDLPQTGEISDIRVGKLADGIALFAWQGADQVYAQAIPTNGVLSSPLEEYDSFDEIGMDDNGDFLVDVVDDTTLSVENGDGESIEINAVQSINTYDFEEGKKKNKSRTFEVVDPIVKSNGVGDFVVVWEEIKTDSIKKIHKTCYTYYGVKSCYPDGYSYSDNSKIKLYAQRYNSDLLVKDNKPVLVAQSKGVGRYISDVSVVMDDDGDFTVAFSGGKSFDKYKKTTDEYGYTSYDGYTLDNSNVFVRQFATNQKGKLKAKKMMKVSENPKLESKHKPKNVTHKEPSLVITDDVSNSFIIMWHNDYEDHYKGAVDKEVCLKYETYKYDGYSYKECVEYGYKTVFEDMYDNKSILNAKRYIPKKAK